MSREILLSCILVFILGVIFASFNGSTLAHDTVKEESHSMPETTAKEAEAGGMMEMKDFALHAKAHLEAIPSADLVSFSKFRKQTRQDGQVFKSGSTYMIVLDRTSRQIMFHGKYTDAAGKNPLNLSDDNNPPKLVVREIINEVEKGGDPYCVEYKRANQNRWACGVQFTYKLFGPKERSLFADALVIVGFDHDKDFLEECKPSILASEVKDEETLRKFVEGAAICIGTTRLPITDRHLARREPGPWKSGEIYLFVMVDGPEEIVLFNGLNADLEDTTLHLTDKNGCNVGDGINDVLNGQSNQNCKITSVDVDNTEHEFLESGGFVEYLWRRPGHPEYDDPDFTKEGEISPGTAHKKGYVVKIDTSKSRIALPYKLIVGSGIYPDQKTANSDDGCAIAGTESNSKNTGFNLFLIVSGLVLAMSWKRRNRSKRD